MQRRSDARSLGVRLDRLRSLRPSPVDRAERVGSDIEQLSGDVLRRSRGLVEVSEVLRRSAGGEMCQRVWPVRLVRGTLTLGATDAGWRARADQWLRAGGQRMLVEGCKGVKKVKVEVVGAGKALGTRH